MSDTLRDTPSLGRLCCPGCEPEADPTAEILDVRWCESHSPLNAGVDDGRVTASAHLLGSVEAGGDDNRRWCEIVHRRGRAVPVPAQHA
jgi:hypothetical protein